MNQPNILSAGALPTAAMNRQDLHEVLKLYNEVTERLQVSHERLQNEVVRLREQLEQKNRELELKKRLAALGEMAAGMAHEIRNPLGGIQLYASTLAAEVADRPLASDLVRKISSGVRSLNALVCDILAFTQQVRCSKNPEDLAELIAGAVDLASPTLQQCGLQVQVAPDVAGIVVSADGRLLARVILNLVLNAAEAIHGAGITGGVITIRASSGAEGRVEIVVADNGPGIPAAALDSIFNPFFTTKHTGTGLGLAIVHRIIEAHGGHITAENRPEGGAQFRIVV